MDPIVEDGTDEKPREKRPHRATGKPRGRPPKNGRPAAREEAPPVDKEALRAAAEAGAAFAVGAYATALETAFPGRGAKALEPHAAGMAKAMVDLEVYYGMTLDPVWLMWGAFIMHAGAPAVALVMEENAKAEPSPAPRDVTPPAEPQRWPADVHAGDVPPLV